MKQVVVGHYDLGAETVELVLREHSGGEYYFQPEKGKCGRIKVGADYPDWYLVVAVLLHETFEYAANRNRAILVPQTPYPLHAIGSDNRTFVFTHARFSMIVLEQADFVAAALPDLCAAWKKWKKGKK